MKMFQNKPDSEGAIVLFKQKMEEFGYLTAEEAAQYTIKNVMAGSDAWQPDLLCEACDAPEPVVGESVVSWKPVPYAICYVITCNNEVIGFTTDTSYPAATDGVYQVQAVNEYGGLSSKATAGEGTDIHHLGNKNLPSQTAIYGIDGTRRTTPTSGLNIIKHEDGSAIKIINP